MNNLTKTSRTTGRDVLTLQHDHVADPSWWTNHRIWPQHREAVRRLSRSEIRRRLVHMLPGLLPFVLSSIPHPHPLPMATLCRVMSLTAVLTIGVLLIYHTIARMGETQRQGVQNTLMYAAVVIFPLCAFPAHPEFAAVVLTVLAFGDGSATLFGMLFGRKPLPWNAGKTWVGFLSFILCSIPLATLAYWMEARPTVPLEVAVICGISAALCGVVAESITSGITDNLRVGVAATIGVLLAHMSMMGWPL